MLVYVFGGLVALALGWMIARAFAAPAPVHARADADAAVYARQLEEVAADLARGALTEADAAAARAEIGRRLLAVSRTAETDAAAPSPLVAPPKWTPVLGAALVGLLAIGAYTALGRPDLPDAPLAARTLADAPTGDEAAPEMAAAIADLEADLERDPTQLDGWILLARARTMSGQFAAGLEAYDRALALAGPEDLDLLSESAEARVIADGGKVSPEVRAVFETVRASDPDQPRAGYFLALAEAQDGKPEAALAAFEVLLGRLDPQTPWRGLVEARIRQLSAELGREPPAPPTPPAPSGARGPTAADIEAAGKLPPEAQLQMIEGMVAGLAARLEADPADPEGWRRLARAYSVLGREADARAAWARLLEQAPGDPEATAALGS